MLAIAFTRKALRKYLIVVDGTKISYVAKHTFLEVTMNTGLTWAPHARLIKHELISFVDIVRIIEKTDGGHLHQFY